ncbi:MAG: CPBP family intramembrane metalloprotease [Erysipelotrichia bacterium]|nr:CPBP family intramembrane metalloprotease [Erysipelotrichia bacterium]
MNGKNRDFTVYILIAFGLGWILQITGMYLGGVYYSIFVALCMFAPIVAVAAIHKLKDIHWRLNFKKSWKQLLMALFLPAVFTVLGGALYFLLNPSAYDPNMGVFAQTVNVPENTVSLSSMMISQIIVAVTGAPLFNAIFAVGEEAGWRGYMTPELQKKFGRVRGILISGVIWALWHGPLIVLAGYEYGIGYFGFPITGILVMCVFATTLGIFLSWLYEKTDSIIVSAIGHGAVNAIGVLPLYFMKTMPTSYLFGPMLPGLISIIPMALFAAFLLKNNKGESSVNE